MQHISSENRRVRFELRGGLPANQVLQFERAYRVVPGEETLGLFVKQVLLLPHIGLAPLQKKALKESCCRVFRE